MPVTAMSAEQVPRSAEISMGVTVPAELWAFPDRGENTTRFNISRTVKDRLRISLSITLCKECNFFILE
jgi:hypothetical protein